MTDWSLSHVILRWPFVQGQEIYTCNTFGPTWGPDSATAGEPPYNNYALNVDISGRTGTTSAYNFATGAAEWPTGSAGWRLDEVCF